MSYILEALKKSQRQREIGQVPTLNSVQASPEFPRHPHFKWSVAAMLLASAALALALFTALGKPPPAPAGYPAPSSAAALPAEPAAAPPSALPEIQDREPAAIPEPTPEPRLAAAPAPPRTDRGGTDSPTVEAISADSPNAFPASMEAIRIEIHTYFEAPDRRFVFIDGRRYREGDRLQSGAILETIVPDGIIVSDRGKRYRVDL